MAEYTDPTESNEQPVDIKGLRHAIGRRVKSVKKYTHKKFKEETKHYLNIYRNEFSKVLPERLLKMDDIDVNIAFPIIKSLIPSLYFKDPQVYVKPGQAVIQVPTGQPDPMTGMEKIQTYDGPTSAYIFQNALNENIRAVNLKQESKDALLDAHIFSYGAIKLGWGNDQGVASMGEGAPPSMLDEVREGVAYGIRLKPWDVFVDMDDFYHPAWIAVRYEVHPEQLKKDSRLQNTEELKGNCEADETTKRDIWSELDKEDFKKTEYFEYYHKPCAEYPEGIFAIFTDEVADDFLYYGPWPYAREESRKSFPIKVLYFNRDPEGGFPIPDMRYYAQQQKAKSLLRRVMYEYVQRSMPTVGLNGTLLDEKAKQQIQAGSLPKYVLFKGNPNASMAMFQAPALGVDFNNLDTILDADVTRMVGMVEGGDPTGQSMKFSSQVKETSANEQLRNSERADIVRDFMMQIVKYWAALYQEFGSKANYTPVDGEEFPVEWSVDQVQGKFLFSIKPFSMNYEDPTIVRRQWVDLLNLVMGPAAVQAAASQGASFDYVKLFNRVLLTYDEPDAKSFIMDAMSKPEAQVAQALQENQAILAGQPVQVQPTDNHMAHMMIHGLTGEKGLEHNLQHQAALLAANPGAAKPGGGNPEGMPLNGNAASQDQMMEPLNPSTPKAAGAETREATDTR